MEGGREREGEREEPKGEGREGAEIRSVYMYQQAQWSQEFS